MPTITDNAVCIRCWDFSETSQTVSLFTRGQGIVRGLAKGAKREKGAFSGGLDVLTRGEVVAIIKPTRDLATLTAWHLQDAYRALRTNLPANRAALYLADLVHHMLLEHDAHPDLYDAFTGTLSALDDEQAVDRALLAFQWTLLAQTGYEPQLHRDARTGAALPERVSTLGFSAAAGGVVGHDETPTSAAAAQGWRVRKETIEVLRAVQAGQDPSPNGEAIRRANRLLAVYFREIIGSEPPAMRWAFGDLNV